jgi:myo-inositol 2-dehydrogenase / D-chiro-inositol 1-dehydrogenase
MTMSNTIRPSRREFLKNSTGVAAGLALAGGLNLAQSVHAAGGDELKIALIGCGGRGTGAVVNCFDACPNVKLVAVADAFADNAKSCLANLQKDPKYASRIDVPADRIFVGFDAYQKVLATDVDIVVLTTPPGFRPIHYAAAIAAGKHVFMEKPCCIDAPGFRSLMKTNKLADEKNLKVVVGLQRRRSKEFRPAVQAIHDGSLGTLNFFRAYWDGGPIWIRKRQPGQTEMEFQMRNWYHFVWLCGDHIVEQHVHNLDVCNWVKGDHPVKAIGMGSCHCRDNRGVGQIYDNHSVEFTYKDGMKMFSQCRQQTNTWSSVTQCIHGTKGIVDLPGWAGDGLTQEHADLVNAIRKGERLNDGWYGATSSFTAVLGRMATYSGQEVLWDEAVAKGPDEMPQRYAFDATPPVVPDKDGNYPMAVPGVYKPY